MQVLRLTNEDRTIIIDLLGGPIGLRSGWEDQTPGMGGNYTYEPYGAQFDFSNYQPVSHSFDLAIKGRPSVVLTEMARLQDFLEAVRLFHSGDLAAKSCWLEWRADCDENAKRSLLYSGQFKVTSQDDVTPTATKAVIIGRLTLTRHPLWENQTYTTLVGATLWTLGGKRDHAGITGNTLGRIWATNIHANSGLNLYRFWLGVRSENRGVTNFNPVWEAETGTAGTDCGAAVLDATASPEHLGAGTGARRRVTFVTLTLASRLTITVGQVAAAYGHTDYDHFQGRYLVLCRCKLSGAGTIGIQLRSGFTGNVISDEVYIDNTDWRQIPLGNISIPPWEGEDYADYLISYRLDVYAEQLTPGINLDLDCLVLIPNEHLVVIEGADLDDTVPADRVTVRVHADDTEVCFEFTSGTINDALDAGLTDWYIPPGTITIVASAEDITDHDLTDSLSVSMFYYPRWLLYRTD